MDIKEIIEDAVFVRNRRTEDVTLNNGTVGELTANVFVVGPYEIRVSVIFSDNETGIDIDILSFSHTDKFNLINFDPLSLIYTSYSIFGIFIPSCFTSIFFIYIVSFIDKL